MRLLKTITLVGLVLLAQSIAVADLPSDSASPFGAIQAQLDALELRTQTLEGNVPDQSVEGRVYCSVLNLQIMRGRANDQSEELQSRVIRRKVSFAGGVLEGPLDSHVLNTQLDDGTVNAGTAAPILLLVATYTQSGSKVDVTFDNGSTANWYVSKDGSLIHGSTIQHRAFGPPGGLPPVVTVGSVRNWTLVETGANDSCDAENQ